MIINYIRIKKRSVPELSKEEKKDTDIMNESSKEWLVDDVEKFRQQIKDLFKRNLNIDIECDLCFTK